MKPCVLWGNPKHESESEEPYCLWCGKVVADAVMDAFHEFAERG